jgi:hypothetical protein
MTLLEKIRDFAHQRTLKQALRQKARPQGRDQVNLHSAQNIGILFDASQTDDRETILRFAERLRKQGKRVSLLGFFDDVVEADHFPFKSFNYKQIDWALRPNAETVKEFTAQEFDLLLHLEPVAKTYSEYIAALSNAKLRVGPSTEHTYCYDLMIDQPAKAGLSRFIQQVEFLLGKTNVLHEPAHA